MNPSSSTASLSRQNSFSPNRKRTVPLRLKKNTFSPSKKDAMTPKETENMMAITISNSPFGKSQFSSPSFRISASDDNSASFSNSNANTPAKQVIRLHLNNSSSKMSHPMLSSGRGRNSALSIIPSEDNCNVVTPVATPTASYSMSLNSFGSRSRRSSRAATHKSSVSPSPKRNRSLITKIEARHLNFDTVGYEGADASPPASGLMPPRARLDLIGAARASSKESKEEKEGENKEEERKEEDNVPGGDPSSPGAQMLNQISGIMNGGGNSTRKGKKNNANFSPSIMSPISTTKGKSSVFNGLLSTPDLVKKSGMRVNLADGNISRTSSNEKSSANVVGVKKIPYPKQHGYSDLRQIFSVRYCPSSTQCAVGSADGVVRIYNKNDFSNYSSWPENFDVPEAEELKLLQRGIQVPTPFLNNALDPITSLNWVTDEKLMWVAGKSINTLEWKPIEVDEDDEEEQAEAEAVVAKHNFTFDSVTHEHGEMYASDLTKSDFTMNGRKISRDSKLAVAGTERHCVIFDLSTLKEVCCIRKSLYKSDSFGHSNRISSVKWQPGSLDVYVTGSWDNSVCLWDIRSGRRERALDASLELVGSGPESVAIKGGQLATACFRSESPVQLWDWGSFRLLDTVATPKGFVPYCCGFVGDNNFLCGGKQINVAGQGSFMAFNKNKKVIKEFHDMESAVWSVDSEAEGVYIAGHADGSLTKIF